MLFVFPGQGSQKVGMGADFHEDYACARDVFHEVDDAISFKLSNLIFNGPEEELKLTQNAQPAIMAVSMAFVRVIEREFSFSLAEHACFFAGHSLGEYSALCAAGVLSLSETASILRLRGRAMADACPSGGAMAAIIGLDISVVREITEKLSHSGGSIVQTANENSPQQTVISGHKDAVEKAMEEAKNAGARRVQELDVSGPFHSILMEPAVEPLREKLSSVNFGRPSKPIISNVTAKAETENFQSLLLQQLTSPVLWTDIVKYAKENGVSGVVEIGPGKVLTGLVKRIDPDLKVFNVNSVEAAIKLAAEGEI